MAQDDAARDHFKRGEAAYDKGAYAMAIEEWQAAYAVEPLARIQYNIYQAQERLGQLAEASTSLQRYLSTADPDDPYYSDATARMAALQQRLQATGIRLVGGVAGGAINVSGHDWGSLPRPDRIAVQPGNHRVVVKLAGYRDFVTSVVVPAGQVVDVPIQLEPLPKEASDAAAAPAKSGPSRATSVGDRSGGSGATPFFITSAVLGAGTIGALVWTLNRSAALSGCDRKDKFCPEESAVTTQRTIAISLTAVLGAGAIGTLIYALLRNGDDAESAALCLPDGAGATCKLRF
jgi:hypothetical protein